MTTNENLTATKCPADDFEDWERDTMAAEADTEAMFARMDGAA